jgi:hypothetical protein
MNYRDSEKGRAKEILAKVIRAEGNGLFGERRYELYIAQYIFAHK